MLFAKCPRVLGYNAYFGWFWAYALTDYLDENKSEITLIKNHFMPRPLRAAVIGSP